MHIPRLTAYVHSIRISQRQLKFIELFIASMVGLYFEMLIIRWLAAEVRLFSYFKNLTLMAAFIGMGIGYTKAEDKTEHKRSFALILLMYVAVVVIAGRITGFKGLVVPDSEEYLWRVAQLPQIVSGIVFAITILVFFAFTMLLFVPLGQLAGGLMVGQPPIAAYLVNLLGSLCGIWLYALVSQIRSPPWVWFLVGLTFFLWFIRVPRRQLAKGLVFTVLCVAILAGVQGTTLWSPYYRLDLSPFLESEDPGLPLQETGYSLSVNQVGHMFAVNLSSEFVESRTERWPDLPRYQTLYDLPYAYSQPSRVLVIGSGMGNDIAAALRHDVAHIDAVEIDPMIYELGVNLHPERPYSSPKVRVFIDDARSYLHKAEAKYDLIVFGILDSQTLLSGMSSVRLDNFIYTVESIAEAREHLNPEGVLSVTFCVTRSWIEQRLISILTQVFGHSPTKIWLDGTEWKLFITGKDPTITASSEVCDQLPCTVSEIDQGESVPVSTDDWPYLYLRERTIPTPYLIVLLLVFIVVWVSTRRAFPTSRRPDWHFFLLGGAFMLVEFKIITELALLFGSTWIVNAIAVSAVLLMIVGANVMISRWRNPNLRWLYLLLFVSLVVGYFTPLKALLGFNTALRFLASGLLVGLPVFFSGAIFATSLRRSGDIPRVFGSNLLGAAAGGMLEYCSLVFGIRSLYIVAFALYVLSWLAAIGRGGRAARVSRS